MSFYSCQGKFAHRIILGEIRGQEAFDLLQLLNTGHAGTLSTIHANSAKQGLARFTSCVLQSGVELPRGKNVAVLLRNRNRGQTLQRIASAETIANPDF